jgi:hypothetical protein
MGRLDRTIGVLKLVLTGLLRLMVRSSRTRTMRGVRHAILAPMESLPEDDG